MKSGFLLAAASAAAVSLFGAALAAGPVDPKIDPAKISEHIKVLASDAFEGRGPATPAEPKVIAYVTGQFKAMGVKPGGEHGGWTQDVPLARFQVTAPVKMGITESGQAESWTQGDQAVVQTLTPVDRVDIKAAPMVFVGYGVKAPERHWDDFKGYDLHGKIAVVLVNDPDFENPDSTLFGGKAMTYYGRWTYKYEEAARQGAVGMLIVHETKPASYGWATVKNSNANAQFDIVRKDASKAHPLLQGWIQRDVAVKLFKGCGLDFDAEKDKAKRADFHPVPLSCATFSADYGVDHSKVITHNIVGILPGKTHPKETVIYSAHWDHLGVGGPDTKGDRIYNGAVDNASGVADVLEIARAFAKAPRTDRSVVFLIVTAEEKGLLGSLYYATHPLYPAALTVADLNIDALHATGPEHDIGVSGGGQNTLEDRLAAAAKARGRYFSPDPELGAGHFYSSDHFSFAKSGVPGISIESGRDLVDGGRAAGNAWSEEYVAHRYHQPADQWTPDMNLTGEAQDSAMLYSIGRTLADSRVWPSWKPTSEFKAARQATASQRR